MKSYKAFKMIYKNSPFNWGRNWSSDKLGNFLNYWNNSVVKNIQKWRIKIKSRFIQNVHVWNLRHIFNRNNIIDAMSSETGPQKYKGNFSYFQESWNFLVLYSHFASKLYALRLLDAGMTLTLLSFSDMIRVVFWLTNEIKEKELSTLIERINI